MSIDERLEAVTHSVELLASMQIETENRLARLTEKVERLADTSQFLQTSMATLAGGIELLTRVTINHHDRIGGLEGNQPSH